MSDIEIDPGILLPALARFREHLSYAGDWFGRDQRTGALAAISATIEFLLAVPPLCSPHRLAPLRALLDAFFDTEKGIVPPLFAPMRQSGRPVDPSSLRTIRAHAAGAMQLLMECLDYSKDEAARLVARELKGLGMSVGNKHNAAKTVASWRDRARRESRSDNDEAMVFHAFIEFLKPLISVRLKQGGDPDSIKNNVLATLRDAC